MSCLLPSAIRTVFVSANHGEPLASRPLYLQARDLMLRRIVDGTWTPGSYLPSEPQLATDLGVSIGTIRKAMEDLVGQGLLERQHGRGTQVVPHSSDRSRFRFLRFVHGDGRPFRPVARVLAAGLARADAEDRARLGLAAGARVLVLLRTRSEDGVPMVYERIALPADLFAQLHAEPGAEMLEEIYVLYQARCGQTVARARDEIATDGASAAVAAALGCAPGAALLLVRRVAVSLAGAPIEYRQSWTAALHYRSDLD
ncbi:GntR family transcriptional regulator [Methylobacterium sp. J-090]|uniref:GntR family transcriptional regulator n=1 Tax=Methylobacterium sp. J-090 TaxID=2836666 RepID=UPI001FBB7DE9|nr:GntR family transcriptional regulator [Methylobacterium sp. J-090]